MAQTSSTSSKSQRQAIYLRPSDHVKFTENPGNSTTNIPTFHIHPESQLYSSSLNMNPHQCLLFIEANVINKIGDPNCSNVEHDDRIFMRHVIVVDSSWLSLVKDSYETNDKGKIIECSWINHMIVGNDNFKQKNSKKRKLMNGHFQIRFSKKAKCEESRLQQQC